jgi:superfamily II DNA or RNA helicase
MSASTPSESFFQKHFNKFNPVAGGFRECQIGAFCAVRSHFSLWNEPCVVSLPTGSGKTALMMALCFGLKARRALIINPAEVLRVQTRDKFEELDDLRSAGAIEGLATSLKPKVESVENELRTVTDWKALAAYDLVTATTRTTSPGLTKIVAPPDGLFDLVLVDEGHHAAATTWKELISAFNPSTTKIVLLTGTPYRRDNKPIGAKTIFIYPIAQAIKDGVYAPVSLIPVGNPKDDARDEELAEIGIKQLQRLRKNSKGKSLVLVKTDRKAHADVLGELYGKKGINLGVVHSDQSHKQNLDAIKSAVAGKSDGLVAVGMLGEGLDVPALKVAIFHRNPQSLPYTLQVIGRLARSKDDLPNGVVVACSDDFSRDTFKLYEGSEDWLKLIPQLEALLVDQISPRYSEQVEASGAHVEIADIRPHFSVTVHRISRPPKKASLKNENFETPRGDFTVVLDHEVDAGLRVFVTRAFETPNWMKRHGRSDVYDERFDVHTFYSGVKGLLVRQTSDESIGLAIQRKFAEVGTGIEPGKLNHVMTSLGGEYLVLGLKNGGAIGGNQPSYKMLLGQRVDASVSNSDRTNCHAGHCLTRKDDASGENSEFRGVAYKSSRVWSLDRDNLKKLGEWMKVIAEAVETKGDATLPQLHGLRQPEPLIEFPGQPIAILPSPALLEKDVTFSRPTSDDEKGFPIWTAGSFTKQKLASSMPDLGVQMFASIDGDNILFSENGNSLWRVEVFPVDGASHDYSLQEFVREYPPVLMFGDGSRWHDGIYTRPAQTPELNAACFLPQNWMGYKIEKEIPDNPPTGDSVHEFVETTFLPSKSSVIGVCDHSKGEVADYVVFSSSSSLVSLYHCKGALWDFKTKRVKPIGVDQKCLEELLAQGMASCRWIRNPLLIEQLKDRLDVKKIARLIACSRAQFNQLAADFVAPLWAFEVVLVQPGLSAAKVQKDGAGKRVRAMLACAEDYIRGCGGSLKVVCS